MSDQSYRDADDYRRDAVDDEGNHVERCGDRITATARRLCGGCAQAWAETPGPEPKGCDILL